VVAGSAWGDARRRVGSEAKGVDLGLGKIGGFDRSAERPAGVGELHLDLPVPGEVGERR
jgi:hypothetical protein